jgi:thioredoxin reductase (NADPH)
VYDVVIVGGGPAGLAAAIYSARYMLKTLVISKEHGGAIMEAHLVENYPGFRTISGMKLMDEFTKQAKDLGVKIQNEESTDIKKENGIFVINNNIKGKKIILALGTKRRKLNIPGEDDFAKKGVSYCATCDAPLYRGKSVAVVGGSNSAARAAQFLAEYAEKVYVIYRQDKLRSEPLLTKKIEGNPKIEIITNANITEIKGDKLVNSVQLDNGEVLMIDGVFIEIGSVPSVVLAKKLGISLDNEECIKVDEGMKTDVEGVYAAGDITTGSNKWRQVITACAEGGIAASSAYKDLKSEE